MINEFDINKLKIQSNIDCVFEIGKFDIAGLACITLD